MESVQGKLSYADNPDFFLRFPDYSSSARRVVVFPNQLILPLNIYLAPSWKYKFNKRGDAGVNMAKEVLILVKRLFLHDSLETKFFIRYEDSDFFQIPTEVEPTLQGLKKLSRYLSNQKQSNDRVASIYLTSPNSSSEYFGIGKILAMCEPAKKKAISIVRWKESTVTTAQTIAHEIGHNLGMYHDFQAYPEVRTGRSRTCGPGKWNGGPTNQLMNYGEPIENTWSSCSNEDFQNFYSIVTANIRKFCLQEHEGNFISFVLNLLQYVL